MCPCFCNRPIFKASVTHVSECAVNVCRKVFKVDLSRLSVSAISVPPFNVVKVTTTPTYQYKNSTFKHFIVNKVVFSTSHVNTSPAPAVVTLNSSFLLHVCDVSVPENLLYHACKVSPPIPVSANITTTSRSYALIKKFSHFTNN